MYQHGCSIHYYRPLFCVGVLLYQDGPAVGGSGRPSSAAAPCARPVVRQPYIANQTRLTSGFEMCFGIGSPSTFGCWGQNMSRIQYIPKVTLAPQRHEPGMPRPNHTQRRQHGKLQMICNAAMHLYTQCNCCIAQVRPCITPIATTLPTITTSNALANAPVALAASTGTPGPKHANEASNVLYKPFAMQLYVSELPKMRSSN